MPAIQTPQPPPQIRTGVLESKQPVVPQARATAAVHIGAFSRNENLLNEAKLPVRTTTSSAGFDAVAATQKSENEPGKAASTGGFGGTVVARAGFSQRSAAVSDAGFGSAETAGSRAPSARQTVRAGFGDAVAAKPQTSTSRPAVPQASGITPVEITFKPRPAYTDEARRAGIEGEILLEAVFSASGEVRVIRIVRGLPHGLNDTALAAVHAIRFRPALRHGAPVDTTATVRMNFELAN
jgi:TonB family protein